MLMKANPANKALADDEAAGLAVHAPAEIVYVLLEHATHVVVEEQTAQFDGQPPQLPNEVTPFVNPAQHTAHPIVELATKQFVGIPE